jgi:hypothetical protein
MPQQQNPQQWNQNIDQIDSALRTLQNRVGKDIPADVGKTLQQATQATNSLRSMVDQLAGQATGGMGGTSGGFGSSSERHSRS